MLDQAMRFFALALCLTGVVGCSSKSPAVQSEPIAAASVAKDLPKAASAKAAIDPLSEAIGPDYQGQAEVERRFKNGLITQDYQLGEGPAAQVGSRLTLRYAGILDNGVVFDENRSLTSRPFRFRLPKRPRVRGWGLGLLGMKAKGRRKITVPSQLGYGASGDRGEEGAVPVPPNARLTYVVELLAVEPPPAKAKAESAFTGPVLAKKRHRNGLVTKDYKLGTGPAAAPGDRLAIYYRGYLPDGSIFDESTSAGAPFQFRLGDRMVIPGWNQGMQGMKPGALRSLKVPAKLAYGKRGIKGVPPNAELNFLVELVALRRTEPSKKDARKATP